MSMGKGISTIIATLLMLVITIALAGFAYTYLSGVVSGRSSVVLSVDPSGTICSGENVVVAVRNDGANSANAVSVTVRSPNAASSWTCTITPNPLLAYSSGSCAVDRGAGQPLGSYTITATGTGGAASGTVSCPTAT